MKRETNHQKGLLQNAVDPDNIQVFTIAVTAAGRDGS